MKYVVSFFVVLFLISGCSSPQISPENIQSTIGTGIEQTQASITTDIPAQIPTDTSVPTNTPRPTITPKPTSTITPTLAPTEVPAEGIAKNYVASDEDAGVVFEVVRIVIAPKDSIDFDFSDEIFSDKQNIVGFLFRISNNTERIVKNSVNHALASVNGEQVDFYDYWLVSDIGDDMHGDILPGSYLIGGYWTGIKRSSWAEVNKIVIAIDQFYDSDYDRVTKAFLFSIDVIDWGFEPLPDELK